MGPVQCLPVKTLSSETYFSVPATSDIARFNSPEELFQSGSFFSYWIPLPYRIHFRRTSHRLWGDGTGEFQITGWDSSGAEFFWSSNALPIWTNSQEWDLRPVVIFVRVVMRKTLCNFELQIWLANITSYDAPRCMCSVPPAGKKIARIVPW